MSAGTVVRVRRTERRETAVEVLKGDRAAQYDRLVALALRMGNWLQSPRAQLLPDAEWNVLFARYQEYLAEIRRLGAELRPVSLRRPEPLAGDALVDEVMELFA